MEATHQLHCRVSKCPNSGPIYPSTPFSQNFTMSAHRTEFTCTTRRHFQRPKIRLDDVVIRKINQTQKSKSTAK